MRHRILNTAKRRGRGARGATTGRLGRGQSLVEFALVLPILLLLLLITVDFGRVYLGWINLQSMARIGANYAANHPDDWNSGGGYRNQILADAAATNCELHDGDMDPQFTDTNGGGVGLGDRVSVQLTCDFSVITPVISEIVGKTVAVSAEANFPVKAGLTSIAGGGGGGGSGGGSAPNAAFVANSSVFSPDPLTVIGPDVTVEFRDTSGGSPASSWAWTFKENGSTDVETDVGAIVEHPFSCATALCTFTVKMTATNLLGDSTATMEVTVQGASEVNFTSDKQVIDRRETVTFKDASAPGGTTYAWDFGDGGAGSGATASHQYNKVGVFDVTLTVTYPAPVGVIEVTKDGWITVNVGMCDVPTLTDVRFFSATAVWQGSPAYFTGTVKEDTGAPGGNFKIGAQSITAGPGAQAPCDSDVYVK